MHDFHGTFSDLLHAANLRHGTDGFTSPPKEGVLRIFTSLKIRRLRPGLSPRTGVLKASTEAAYSGVKIVHDWFKFCSVHTFDVLFSETYSETLV
jgi:hypothetical protein